MVVRQHDDQGRDSGRPAENIRAAEARVSVVFSLALMSAHWKTKKRRYSKAEAAEIHRKAAGRTLSHCKKFEA